MKEEIIKRIAICNELINESVDLDEHYYYTGKKCAYQEILKLIEDAENNI